MSTVMKELKAEISRLARREIKKALAPVQRVNAARRGLIADLRRQVVALRKELNGLRKTVPQTVAGPKELEAGERFWITGKGMRSLRKRLGLTQAELGVLAGVSIPTVVNWEGTQGKIAVRRKETVGRLRSIRTLNKRGAAEILAKTPKAKAKARARAKTKAKAKA